MRPLMHLKNHVIAWKLRMLPWGTNIEELVCLGEMEIQASIAAKHLEYLEGAGSS